MPPPLFVLQTFRQALTQMKGEYLSFSVASYNVLAIKCQRRKIREPHHERVCGVSWQNCVVNRSPWLLLSFHTV